ncbi:TPA: orotidine-5'-phosphate decarboxylase [Streptococcus suis]
MDKTKPIIALDFQDRGQVENFLGQFDEALNVKVGMELFYSSGLDMIHAIKAQGHDIFLDLKLHDIPNTVKGAMRALAGSGVAMINVHTLGGKEMMVAAREGLILGTPTGQASPILLGVTQLTSTSPQQVKEEQLVTASMEAVVTHLAGLAKDAGLDGVVCSPLEAGQIKTQMGPQFLTVTPGVRIVQGQDDQKRTSNPYQAALMGSDYIVVGRPITKAIDPVQAYQQMKDQWQEGLKERHQREKELKHD